MVDPLLLEASRFQWPSVLSQLDDLMHHAYPDPEGVSVILVNGVLSALA